MTVLRHIHLHSDRHQTNLFPNIKCVCVHVWRKMNAAIHMSIHQHTACSYVYINRFKLYNYLFTLLVVPVTACLVTKGKGQAQRIGFAVPCLLGSCSTVRGRARIPLAPRRLTKVSTVRLGIIF